VVSISNHVARWVASRVPRANRDLLPSGQLSCDGGPSVYPHRPLRVLVLERRCPPDGDAGRPPLRRRSLEEFRPRFNSGTLLSGKRSLPSSNSGSSRSFGEHVESSTARRASISSIGAEMGSTFRKTRDLIADPNLRWARSKQR
jgi:hypothetical protein